MQYPQEKTVPCSVGILTLNSEKTLRRALESVKDFSNIIISDGGSTDDTLAIAKEYGCMIIDQYAKMHPGPKQWHPITDFSRERNRLLAAATEEWFLWIDSDEYISDELHDEIRAVCTADSLPFHAYELPIVYQSPDATHTYITWKQNRQMRLFNLTFGGTFTRNIHEKFTFTNETYSVGVLSGAWFVPLNKTHFSEYKKIVSYRIMLMVSNAPERTVLQYMNRALLLPVRNSLVILLRYVLLRISHPFARIMPIYTVRNALYMQFLLSRENIHRMIHYKNTSSGTTLRK